MAKDKEYQIIINVTASNKEAAAEAAYELLRTGGEPDKIQERKVLNGRAAIRHIPNFDYQKGKGSKGGYYVRGGNTAYRCLEVWFPTEALAYEWASELNVAGVKIEALAHVTMCKCGKSWADHVAEGFASVSTPCRHFELNTAATRKAYITLDAVSVDHLPYGKDEA
jgi:hypothetical protein